MITILALVAVTIGMAVEDDTVMIIAGMAEMVDTTVGVMVVTTITMNVEAVVFRPLVAAVTTKMYIVVVIVVVAVD